MNKPYLKNIVVITEEEKSALIRLFSYMKSQYDGTQLAEEAHEALDFLRNQDDKILFPMSDLPEGFFWLSNWRIDVSFRDYKDADKEYQEQDFYVLHSVYDKLRKAMNIESHQFITVPKNPIGIKQAHLVDIVMDCCYGACRTDDRYYTRIYPTTEQADHLYDVLTNYLLNDPEAPMQYQTMRKKVYKVKSFLLKQQERYQYYEHENLLINECEE